MRHELFNDCVLSSPGPLSECQRYPLRHCHQAYWHLKALKKKAPFGSRLQTPVHCWLGRMTLSHMLKQKEMECLTFKFRFGSILKGIDILRYNLSVDDQETLAVEHVGNHEHLEKQGQLGAVSILSSSSLMCACHGGLWADTFLLAHVQLR